MLTVSEALEHILSDAKPLTGTEHVSLTDAAGRVLAAPVEARVDQPPFSASAMDGYAVRLSDLGGPDGTFLTVIGEAAAGHAFERPIGHGECVRIFTGAPLPDGADAIVIQENVRRDGDTMSVVSGQCDPAHVRRRGADFSKGETLLDNGHELTARDVTLAAAMGHAQLRVRRRPLVGILATGDELVPPGASPRADQIISSNPYGIAAMVSRFGGVPRLLGIARDSREALLERVDQAPDCDVLVTIGGASVGDHDLVAPVLEARGLKLDFWKIAMRPGKPLMFGRLGRQFMIGLPGNPVSSLICTRLFVVPLIARLGGGDDPVAATRELPLAADLGANGPREHYMRARRVADRELGRDAVKPSASQDSALLSVLAEADVLIRRAPHAPALSRGEFVTVIDLDF